eukprot:939781-Pyramimonas_sp.AAC.1
MKAVKKKEAQVKQLLIQHSQGQTKAQRTSTNIAELEEWKWVNNDEMTKELNAAVSAMDHASKLEHVAIFMIKDFASVKSSISAAKWPSTLLKVYSSLNECASSCHAQVDCLNEMHERRLNCTTASK